MTTGIILGLMLLVIVIYLIEKLGKYIKAFFKGFVAFCKAPVKFVKTIKTRAKARKLTKAKLALDKALLLADAEARLNAAKTNPNFRNHSEVKKALRKIETLEE
ncbi:MAG: hypothetical protein ACK5MR_10190 [Cumulibacter sp.]